MITVFRRFRVVFDRQQVKSSVFLNQHIQQEKGLPWGR